MRLPGPAVIQLFLSKKSSRFVVKTYLSASFLSLSHSSFYISDCDCLYLIFPLATDSIYCFSLITKMKSSHILAVAPLLSITHAIVQLDLVAKRGLITRAGSLIRRDNGDAPDGSTISQDTAYSRYFVNVTIGEPGQTFTLHMDTGSSDVWVNAKGANITLPPSDPQGPAGGTCKFLMACYLPMAILIPN